MLGKNTIQGYQKSSQGLGNASKTPLLKTGEWRGTPALLGATEPEGWEGGAAVGAGASAGWANFVTSVRMLTVSSDQLVCRRLFSCLIAVRKPAARPPRVGDARKALFGGKPLLWRWGQIFALNVGSDPLLEGL